MQVHEAVIAAGKTRSGCTVHQVTEEVDSGPIMVQEEVEVIGDETPESLKAKVRGVVGFFVLEVFCASFVVLFCPRRPLCRVFRSAAEAASALTWSKSI